MMYHDLDAREFVDIGLAGLDTRNEVCSPPLTREPVNEMFDQSLLTREGPHSVVEAHARSSRRRRA